MLGFLVIGAQKTGTSALYEYLNGTHPQLQLEPHKEMLHWGPPHGPNSGIFKCSAMYRATYLDRFVNVSADGNTMTGDFSATDVACACCPAAIYSLVPHVKLILLMRNPIDRAKSRYPF